MYGSVIKFMSKHAAIDKYRRSNRGVSEPY